MYWTKTKQFRYLSLSNSVWFPNSIERHSKCGVCWLRSIRTTQWVLAVWSCNSISLLRKAFKPQSKSVGAAFKATSVKGGLARARDEEIEYRTIFIWKFFLWHKMRTSVNVKWLAHNLGLNLDCDKYDHFNNLLTAFLFVSVLRRFCFCLRTRWRIPFDRSWYSLVARCLKMSQLEFHLHWCGLNEMNVQCGPHLFNAKDICLPLKRVPLCQIELYRYLTEFHASLQLVLRFTGHLHEQWHSYS